MSRIPPQYDRGAMGSACYPSASYSSLPSCYYFAFPVDPKSTEMMQRELGVSAVRRLEFGRSLRHLSWLPSGPANAIVNRRYPECLRRDYTKHHLLACCTRLMTILLWSAGSRARMWKNLMKGSAIYEQLRKEWCYHRAPGHHSGGTLTTRRREVSIPLDRVSTT